MILQIVLQNTRTPRPQIAKNFSGNGIIVLCVSVKIHSFTHITRLLDLALWRKLMTKQTDYNKQQHSGTSVEYAQDSDPSTRCVIIYRSLFHQKYKITHRLSHICQQQTSTLQLLPCASNYLGNYTISVKSYISRFHFLVKTNFHIPHKTSVTSFCLKSTILYKHFSLFSPPPLFSGDKLCTLILSSTPLDVLFL